MKPNIDMKLALAGEYRLVINAGTPQERDTGWFPNLITDIGLDRIGASIDPTPMDYCRIGTGTTAPAFTDQALEAQVASAWKNSGLPAGEFGASEGAPTYAYLQTCYFTFAQGAVVGNMSEIGVGWAASGNTLFSRARILDGSGNPTTITLLSIDQLTVYYRIRWFPPLTDGSGTLTLSGVPYAYTSRVSNVGTFQASGGGKAGDFMLQGSEAGFYADQSLGPTTGTPAGTSYGVSTSVASFVEGAYVSGTHQFTVTLTVPPPVGNPPGGIGSMTFHYTGGMNFQFAFATKIPKDNTKTLSLGVTVSWARA